MKKILLFLLVFPVCIFAQQQEVFRIDSLSKEGVLLDKGWKWHAGDNPEWAKAGFDDTGWQSINPTLDIVDSLPQIPRPSGIFWMRLQLKLNRRWLKKHLALQVSQTGASEIYLNGRLIKRLGKVSAHPNEISAYDPLNKPIPFHLEDGSNIVLSIRYTLQPNLKYTLSLQRHNPAFKAQVNTLERAQIQIDNVLMRLKTSIIVRIGEFLILLICYASFYSYYPRQKSNLFFSLFALFLILNDILQFKGYLLNEVDQIFNFYSVSMFFFQISIFFLLTALYSLLNQKRSWVYWTLLLTVLLSFYIQVKSYHYGGIFNLIITNVLNIEIVHITLKSIKIKKRGSWIIAVGGIGFLLFWSIFILSFVFHFINNPLFGTIYSVGDFSYNLSLLSIPVAVNIYFGLDIAVTNRSLEQKLIEVEFLSAEKNQILQTQNETLETQVAERTAELSSKNRELEIEAALETVRASSMAMNHSNDLEKVVYILSRKLIELGFSFEGVLIFIFEREKRDIYHWIATSHLSKPIKVEIPYQHEMHDNLILRDFWEAIETEKDMINITYTGKEKDNYFRFLRENNKAIIPEEILLFQLEASVLNKKFIEIIRERFSRPSHSVVLVYLWPARQ